MKNLLSIVSPFFYGDDKKYARWGGVLLLIYSQITTAYGYFFIQWNRRFYDALEAKNGTLFFRESLVFAGLALTFVMVSSSSRYFGQQYALRWRVWMTKNALSFWLNSSSRSAVEGSEQRIQEDLMRFTTIFERFFLNSFNSLLLIIIFIPLLFSQTKGVQLGGFSLPWSLLLAVTFYTVTGIYVAAKIANPLIQIEYDNQKLEAELRYKLVHARDGADVKVGLFHSLLSQIIANYHSMYNRQKYFNLWQASYDQLSILIPFALLASNYFAGILSLGALFQVKSTFSRIRNSMAYLLDHYAELTEMLAISRRLVEFYKNVNSTFITTPVQNLVDQPG
jgi:ABC-type long-subunit fatty acid transport system fused permease/ATPase subunit